MVLAYHENAFWYENEIPQRQVSQIDVLLCHRSMLAEVQQDVSARLTCNCNSIGGGYRAVACQLNEIDADFEIGDNVAIDRTGKYKRVRICAACQFVVSFAAEQRIIARVAVQLVAAPMPFIDPVSVSIREALPRVAAMRNAHGSKKRIRIVASGKLVNPGDVVWALCAGTDFVTSVRGFMFSLCCIQALKCNKNTCPTGITTHIHGFRRALCRKRNGKKSRLTQRVSTKRLKLSPILSTLYPS